MTAALKALLKNVIDYAGLFPPASLSLDASIRNYARDLASDDAWMLARFVCPVARLNDLLPYVDELFTETMPLTVAALTQDLANERVLIDRFREGASGKANVDVVETKQVVNSRAAETAGVRAFVEVPVIGADREKYVSTVRSIAEQAPQLGLKLRSGGTEAGAFPTSQQIAFAMTTARDARCPMKFTAGLHHPIRLFHESVGTKMHGFINVFVAGVLAHVHGMDEHGIALVLESESPADFTFDEYGLAWKTLRASTQRIEQVRKNGLISFGSCSFDEPRDDLRTLGWM